MSNSLFSIIKNLAIDPANTRPEQIQDIKFDKIWDKLCFNIKAGREDCRSFAEDNYHKILFWWQGNTLNHEKLRQGELNFLNLLCIEILEVCCPEGHFGPQCLLCNGYPDRICSNNGKCAGSGTRLGNGHCICNRGYAGLNCDLCDKTYYLDQVVYKQNGSILCVPCDPSCSGTCFDGGPKGCHVCKNGFEWVSESGCVDLDECDLPNQCPENSFCINTEECDPACNGCEGDGPDSCLKCAKDHILKDGVCVNPEPKPLIPPYASPARYVTYFGLCLVTCIIFRHNIFVASAIGLAVAMYIMASEKSLETEYGRVFDKWLSKMFR